MAGRKRSAAERAGRELWSVVDVAAWADVTDRTVYRWVQARSIPFRKIGRAIRFDRVELEAWSRKHGLGAA